jgi:hypothetical protein
VTARRAGFRSFQGGFKTPGTARPTVRPSQHAIEDAMFKTQYEHPATVLLSALWGLAALLAIAAFAVSAVAAIQLPGVASTLHAERAAEVKNVESVTSSSMLREPRHAISKDKLD